jgi:hypothetical protein
MRICKWLLFLVLAIARRGWAQGDRCADYHIANPQADPFPEHTYDWETSAHGRNVVGCQKCHDGDATTFESVLAHRGILTSRNPASPTHRTNLPQTCGKCHIGPFVELQKSRHYQVLRESGGEGLPAPPATVRSPPVFSRLALSKRGATLAMVPTGSTRTRTSRPTAASFYRRLLAVRELLATAPKLIGRVKDPVGKKALEDAYEQAQVPLREAVHSAHAFVFDQMRERLKAAKERSEALLTELANP